ncbi:MAG: hypothetical protein JNJ90_07155 [Saprospiraceae bacterium]|jgi:hypothetical protein|nr:hypothetical protein [Saprospiraceae bacterium]
MNRFAKIILTVLFFAPFALLAQVQVTYKLEYNMATSTYTVSMNSNTAYNPPLSRIAASTQVTIVVPQISGGWQLTDLTNLTALQWGSSFLDGSTLSLSKDYFFFAPTNAAGYSPFAIAANTDIPLFSFKSGSGCVGDLLLYDNINDPLNAHPSINGDNNIVILGAGAGNKYVGNTSGNVACALPCTADAGVLSY